MTSTTQGPRFRRFLARDGLATQSHPRLHECDPSIGPSSASPPLRIDGGERLRWVYCRSGVGFWSLYLKFVGGPSRFDNRPRTEMDAKSEPRWRGRTKELTSVPFVAHAARAGVSRIKWLDAFSEISGGRCPVTTCGFVAGRLLGRPLPDAFRRGTDRGPSLGCDLGDRHDRRVRMAGVTGDPLVAGFVLVFPLSHARIGHRRINHVPPGGLGGHSSQRTRVPVSHLTDPPVQA